MYASRGPVGYARRAFMAKIRMRKTSPSRGKLEAMARAHDDEPARSTPTSAAMTAENVASSSPLVAEPASAARVLEVASSLALKGVDGAMATVIARHGS